MDSKHIPSTSAAAELTATVLRERPRLWNFIRRRVRDPTEAEDILQDVFHDFVGAYHLPEPIEQAGAWLLRVARNRIVDRFRKHREQSLEAPGAAADDDVGDDDYQLDLALPAADGGPEAAFARSVLLSALQQALEELPANQREVFIAHEIDGSSFKELAARSGVAIGTLLARKRYAVRYLRKRLQALYDEMND